MNNLEHMLQDLAETRVAEHRARLGLPDSTEIVVEWAAASAEPVALHVVPEPSPSACDREGHEYHFGICLDCEGIDPNFEPDDDMIVDEYLRPYDRKAAA